ncbi:hypothetical protein BCR42DRAFT_426119 [Absidia repens]|uniref:Uncharacterized protein n=1 Tax=Absidia repens TaxID=90262 RepID=A0A1X2I1S5_9FUNG|nr:hypothetical protein BCR42DRAFT_426119 [Absidia repens]
MTRKYTFRLHKLHCFSLWSAFGLGVTVPYKSRGFVTETFINTWYYPLFPNRDLVSEHSVDEFLISSYGPTA